MTERAVPVPLNPAPFETSEEPIYDISSIQVPNVYEDSNIQQSVWPENSPEEMPYYRPEWYEEQKQENETPESHVIVIDIFGRD